MFWHYVFRAVFLVAIAIAGVLIVEYSPLNRVRLDISDSKISTLAPATLKLLDELSKSEDQQPIKIEAYVGNNVPSEYVKIKYDLVNLLREFDVLGGKRIDVSLHQGIEPFSEDAILAEKKYGIRPRKVSSQSRGALREEDLILGVAFSSGLERIVIPFMPYGVPVEYELMRSINTVAKAERKTVGVVQTDALVMGAMISVEGQASRIPRLRIISELEKQYNVELVDAATPISLWIEDEDGKPTKRRYDVLLVVQPSQTTSVEMKNIINAIHMGQPTAIFEDPLPSPKNFGHVKPTFYPRMFARNGRDAADIQDLWDAIDLDVDRQRIQFPAGQPIPQGAPSYDSYIVWQPSAENPYRRNPGLMEPEQLIIHERDPRKDPMFSGTDPATQGIDELYLQFTGYIQPVQKSALEFDALVNTGMSGRVQVSAVMRGLTSKEGGSPTRQFTLAGHIHGSEFTNEVPATDEDSKKISKQKTNVIYVADIDTLSDFYVMMRASPIVDGVEYRYQNISFALNIIDSLVGETAYLDLRTRKIDHVTLEVVEETYEEAMQKVFEADQQLQIEMTTKLNQAENEIREKIQPLQEEIQKLLAKKAANEPYDAVKLAAKQGLLNQQMQDQSEKYRNKQAEFENERLEAKRRIDLNAELEIQEIQRKFKLAAVIIPPIPPLLVGLIVFTRRRLREREGISKARRLK